jgi:hypothetical protein
MNTNEHELDLREQLIHIDQMLADIERNRQVTYWTPAQVAFAGITACAAFFAAGAAVGALLIKLYLG